MMNFHISYKHPDITKILGKFSDTLFIISQHAIKNSFSFFSGLYTMNQLVVDKFKEKLR